MEKAAPFREVSCPRALRIVAYILMFQGICSATRMVVGPFMGQGLKVDFGALSIFAALGLIWGSRGWRIYAIIVLALFTGSGMLLLGVIVYWTCADRLPGSWYVLDPPSRTGLAALSIVFAAVLASAGAWGLRVLLRGDVSAYCSGPSLRRTPTPPHVDAMLATVAGVAFLIALVPSQFQRLENPKDTGRSIGLSSRRMGTVQYGYRFDRLAYVVLQEADNSSSWCVGGGDPEEKTLDIPGRGKVQLPNHTQLYEIIDGQFRESPERVTREQFEAFLKSDPNRYTIDALLEFARKHPADGK